ncbi:hypothetical protein LR48_Vigan10g222700 [Vigna angularis]|uniref:Uncharacterized protein n=1 Tax=Phaseolus angularis TaxID=3914 RepID=A0A0L9VMQ3_PHAAN|nr:hypothetical protein LR48_Vigan10g222700 [Vigna angularis]
MEEVEMAEHKVTESCSSNTREPSICIKKAEEEEVESLEKKLPDLFGYYKEFMAEKVEINLSSQWSGSGDDLFEDLEVLSGTIMLAEPVTYRSVRAMILDEGMRISYGLSKAGADVLEDSPSRVFGVGRHRRSITGVPSFNLNRTVSNSGNW